MDNLSGTVIKGYQLLERIGAGGFGAVYRAQQTTVGREVAVKIILPGFANKPDFIRRFETEAQLVARLEHMHITPLYDYWRDPSGAYLIMRYLRGGSLRDALKTEPYDLQSTSRLIDQVTAGLALAHRNGVVHRDLKPGNILLDEDSNAYLADFGIAKVIGDLESDLTKSGIIGSLDYISPEQARSDSVTPRTDIYSLGVVLYETITGTHPFPGSTSVERLYKHLNEPLPKITTLGENLVQDEVNAVIQKATAKNPAKRFEDVLAFAAAFREAIGISPTNASEKLVESLTLREQEVLRCIIDGLSNREIAQKLVITLGTVKWYVNQIYHKLGVRARVQAIVRARELNLVIPDSTSADFPEKTRDSAVSILLPEPENPYKGLKPFEAADHRIFFGREKIIQKLVSHLAEPKIGRTDRFLAVIGPSGSGKSSLVKAGLIPALWRGDLPASERWFVVEMLPGAHPLDELEIALLKVAADQSGNLREQLQRDSRGLQRVAQLILPEDGSELVVVIDQFEEVFTHVEDETTRVHFLDLLTTAVQDSHSRVRVIITLRADFYDRPLHYPEFGDLVRAHMETILPLSANELQQAIVRPAKLVGVEFEDGLVPSIIEAVHYQSGALPLLQFALTDLFDRREGRILTLAAYQDMGGAVGALATRADAIYNDLIPAGQAIVRQMFLRMVTLGEGVEDTRRRVDRAELMALASTARDKASEDMIEEILDTYTAFRLLSADHDPGSRAPTIEVAHEAILREWTRLRVWLDESRMDIHNQRALARAAAEWSTAAQDPSFLLRGSRLDQFEGWAAETDIALTEDERSFLEAGLVAQREHQAKEAERQARETQLEERSRRNLRMLVAVFAVATVIAVMLSFVAFNQQGLAQQSESTAVAAQAEALELAESERKARATQQALAESESQARSEAETEASARATAQAEALAERDRAVEAEQDALYQASIGLASQAIQELNGDYPERGGILAFEALSNYPYSWQAERALSQAILENRLQMIITNEAASEYSDHDLSPDGTIWLAGDSTGGVTAFDTSSGEVIFQLTEGKPRAASWSPDGSKILTAGDSGFQVWDNLGNLLLEGDAVPMFKRCKWNPWASDGERFVIAQENATVSVFDAQTGIQLLIVEGREPGNNFADWSPSGDYIMVSWADNEGGLYDADSGKLITTIPGNEAGYINLLAWSPSEEFIALGGDGVHVFDILTGQEVFSRPGNTIWAGSWSPDGKILVTSSLFGGFARAWDFETGDLLGSITDLVQGFDVTWSPSGDLVAVGGIGVRVWDPRSDQEYLHLRGLSYEPRAIFWSPDGDQIFASGTSTTSILVFDLTSAESTIMGPKGPAIATWSNDAAQIARGYQDGSVKIYDAGSGEVLMDLYSGSEWAGFVKWSPDGERIFTLNSDGNIKIWDAQTGELEIALTDLHHHDFVFSADWSPDGAFLVTLGWYDGRPIIWDTHTWEQVLIFEGFSEWSSYVSWSPDGSRIISAGSNGEVLVWNPETGETLMNLFPEDNNEWFYGAKWSNDSSKVVVFSPDRVGYVFDLETGEQISQLCCQDGVWEISWSPTDERIFSTAGDGTAKVWDVATGVELIVYDVGGWPSGAYSTDGRHVLIATGDGTTRIYPTWHTTQELIEYAQDCCIIRELTVDERKQFGLE